MGSRYRNASSWPAYGNRMEKKLKTICRKKAQAELVPVDPEGKVMGGNQCAIASHRSRRLAAAPRRTRS